MVRIVLLGALGLAVRCSSDGVPLVFPSEIVKASPAPAPALVPTAPLAFVAPQSSPTVPPAPPPAAAFSFVPPQSRVAEPQAPPSPVVPLQGQPPAFGRLPRDYSVPLGYLAAPFGYSYEGSTSTTTTVFVLYAAEAEQSREQRVDALESDEKNEEEALERAESAGETEDDEETESPIGRAIGATLLAGIVFLMGLVYCTNHSDQDMRRYTYEVISATVGIFCAVLFFTSLREVERGVLDSWHTPEGLRILLRFVSFLFWYIFLQFALAVLSGVIKRCRCCASTFEGTEANMRCFAVLLAHITGFASIQAWCGLQSTYPFKLNWGLSLLVVPMAMIVLNILRLVTSKIRECVALRDDGVKDEYERLWDSGTVEAEIDIYALTISFLLVQCLRFLLTGLLPPPVGEDRQAFHAAWTTIVLFAVGAFFAISVFVVQVLPKCANKEVKFQRKLATATLGMGFAWCFFRAISWSLRSIFDDGMIVFVVCAALTSVLSFLSIRILDMIADSDCTGEEVDKAITYVIAAIGFLVGFAWEQCFDEALEKLAEGPIKSVSELLLAICCCLIVIPAWRWYILPMAIHEGWLYGFVVYPGDEKWGDLLQKPRIQQAFTAAQMDEEKAREFVDHPSVRKLRSQELSESDEGED